MRIGFLSPLALALLAGISLQAQASSDDSCYPDWRVSRDSLEPCSNQPFLSPGNDSRVNLRLLLADKKAAPLTPNALGEDDLAQGFGPVPFPVYRLTPAANAETDADSDKTPSPELDVLLASVGIKRDDAKTAGEAFLNGEGSRCRSNSEGSATAFISQVIKAQMPATERDLLVKARLQLLTTCNWDGQVVDAQQTPSANAQLFRTYLQAAADFYSGRFGDAERGFAAAATSDVPWLKETALYMTARTSLNQAQAEAFDEYGMPQREHVDKAALSDAEEGFLGYLKTYPQGDYVASARGLLRRVHWLANDEAKLAADFTWQLTEASDAQRNVSVNALVEEADLKLLMVGNKSSNSPMLQAVSDLMAMRAHTPPLLTREDLDKQKATFANEPALFDYLQAAHALYVEHQPDTALKHLPADVPSNLDYFTFSQQTLRALALEAKQDWKGAEALWLQLLPLAKQPLQRDQLELALAMNYERSGQLAKVFAADSPISAKQVRYILLRNVAGPDLLRQQIAKASDPTERQSAQFVLLYKDLLHGQYATFADDLKQASLSEDKLGTSLGYTYTSGQTLKLFQWDGDKAESGYACPSIAQTAATLQDDAKNPHALNCFGEFILRNGLDGMPLEQPRAAGSLGSTASQFKGETFSRLDGYKQVIANAKAPKTDKAYALFRAINCYAPAGYNSCGGEDVAPAVRKAWFRQLKTGFADTQWGKSLQYYW
ncbi:outer membrane assembly lipoprotein YfiO [Pseudomonas haemolytica]|uniref:Outer membrane assembly lipoprotein YfiO n=1 Tax=Pseudomonas haemolytica TaxID=2600065 RepID=A0A5P1DDR3_9PSED|nr:outer membrane assembly lipoprotein YfiO [Pseudomonas haemolytica]MBJ2246495.1 outer membrane assembly lipoprotein YfiO [Pseudomonas haemolytica]MBJ2274191.1 outer membrane assembly lipoprotein YfiO [Pseudomonas haemolytica]MBK3448233.1 outer membrane assembly lipoprotein YfiO [Pseudomonas haemolytica]MBK3462908.1 outer membrane assembly lipoprotein YfiO [Pseudomonas haemolytica]MRJ38647.1 outer membrane assembly lipoprotein YfiO [Pseudomonas haemolytica]